MEKLLLLFGHYSRQSISKRERDGRNRVDMERSFCLFIHNVATAGITVQFSLQQEIGDKENQVKSLGN